MIEFGPEVCRDFHRALEREWLETNGLGGYASSTLMGLNARRYHGLLIAATKPPVARTLLLSKFEERLLIDGVPFDLSTNEYVGAVHPQGFHQLARFRLDPFPVFTYEAAGVVFEKSLFMVHGENSTVVQYELRESNASEVELLIRPLVAFRNHHHLAREESNAIFELRETPSGVALRGRSLTLHFAYDTATVDRASYWYRNFIYRRERERGLDFVEDLFSPFALCFRLQAGRRTSIIVSTEERAISAAEPLRAAEIARRMKILAGAPMRDPLVEQLTAAADQFIVARGTGKTVIAGYHWFSDWGRDTMISLPGLAHATRRFDAARDILREFARCVDGGMIPNRFPDEGEVPEYNTVDATLWFFEAVRSYVVSAQDEAFVRAELYDVLNEIIDWHVRGTRYCIRMDDDHLLMAGTPETQLTWMDAKVGDWIVTPRHGKPVEIQALWYNALQTMAAFAHRFGDKARARYLLRLADGARRSFNLLFWNAETECLFDVVNVMERDPSVRPNQIFAVSLHHSMLDLERARKVVAVVERELLTPRGLRTLSPRDPRYRGSYVGGPVERDGAYHQGTVWAWLMGPFVTAYLKVYGSSPTTRAAVRRLLRGFNEHLREAGIGQVSEIFDGDAPHAPRGAIAQAWSVAELLRIAAEHAEVLLSAEP
ncbi:MAG: glycogen debranching protein [Pyrinomonas sp.]|uniref:amylo-alpha-1,6-glucosidase n=1 Tax=Pyrinomonas sp. TaxID=2080306 RepID=UPI003322C8E1